ncbi:hypothetical protein GQ457_16G027520 [Hibiscus cannabinus]
MEGLKSRPATCSPFTPLGFLERAATVYGDCTSIVCNHTSSTWSHIHRRCLQLVSSLSSTGIGTSHVVSVLAHNIPTMQGWSFNLSSPCPVLSSTTSTPVSTVARSPYSSSTMNPSSSTSILSRSLALEAISLFPHNKTPPLLIYINDHDDVAVDSRFCCTDWNKLSATEQARLKSRQGVRTLGLTEADVVDPESGLSVKRDGSTPGEIVLKGASVMLGYLKDPIATNKCMKKTVFWLTTSTPTDGYMEIKDRSKDVIISGSENLSSIEVESVLYLK